MDINNIINAMINLTFYNIFKECNKTTNYFEKIRIVFYLEWLNFSNSLRDFYMLRKHVSLFATQTWKQAHNSYPFARYLEKFPDYRRNLRQ